MSQLHDGHTDAELPGWLVVDRELVVEFLGNGCEIAGRRVCRDVAQQPHHAWPVLPEHGDENPQLVVDDMVVLVVGDRVLFAQVARTPKTTEATSDMPQKRNFLPFRKKSEKVASTVTVEAFWTCGYGFVGEGASRCTDVSFTRPFPERL